MKLTKTSIAMTTCFVATVAHSAGLERSQQPIAPLFEDGNYAEISYGHVVPNINATDLAGNNVDNMLDNYGMEGAAVKVAPTKNSALALIYNKPWGVDTTYPTGNILNNQFGTTEAHVETESLGLMVGGKPNGGNVMIYGGVEYQTVSGYVKAAKPLGPNSATGAVLSNAQVTPQQYQALIQGQQAGALSAQQQAQLQGLNQAISTIAMSPTLYNLQFEKENTLVPMVGIAFEKPEIAMRTAVTYRAPAKYNVKGTETVIGNLGGGVIPLSPSTPGNTKVEFPQSVSVDFETGLSQKHQLLGMVNARWVNWSEYEVSPPLSSLLQNGEPLAEYADDQYSIEVALAKKLNPKLAAEIRASYDSGTGEPLSALGPYSSVTGIAVGAQYDVTEKLAIGGGVQYMLIEGGEVPSSNPNIPALKVDDGDGYAVGMKLGYHF